MKHLLLSIFLAPFVNFIQAQSLIIDRQNFNFEIKNDTSQIAETANVAIPKQGFNVNWDYSMLKSKSEYVQEYYSPTNPAFLNSRMTTPYLGDILANTTYYIFDDYRTIDTLGYYLTGAHIPKQYFSLTNITGGKDDSLIIDDQNDVYSTPKYFIKFPAKFEDVVVCNNIGLLNMQLSIVGEGLSNAPFKRKRYMTQIDSVIGLGTINLPTKNSSKSNPTPTLLFKRTGIIIDSFYINNQPASPALLSALNFTQGTIYNSNRFVFWRENSRTPLLIINTSPDYQKATYVIYDSRKLFNLGLETLVNEESQIALFPNPTNGNSTTMNLLKSNEKPWTLRIYNTLGQLINNQTIQGIGQIQVEVKIPEAKGLYIVSVVSENGIELASEKIIKE